MSESITGESVVNLAMADLGVIRPGEAVSTTVMTDCLLRLNQMLASLSIEQLMSQSKRVGSFPLSAGVSRYTFGVGGGFGTAVRPQKATAWRASYGNFQSGGPVLTFEELQSVSRDGVGGSATIPSAVGADTSSPLINVGVFPVPGSVAGTLELTYWIALVPFVTGAAAVDWPDGWGDFLHFSLAIELSPRYGRQGANPSALISNFQMAKAKVADLNRSASQQAPPPAPPAG